MILQEQTIQWKEQQPYTIGVISYTHGLLRPEVMTSFKGVDFIRQAGDLGDPDVINHLESVAPLVVVRGNMDYGAWAERLPVSKSIAIGKTKLFIIHDIEWIDDQVVLQDYQVIITGHTHRALIHKRDNILFVNPGSAGPRRNLNSVSIGKIFFRDGRLNARLVELNV
ncbi:MAG: metallophosphoesterase family protein [Deltaproteobacteria bacterium]|jgi:putative phosphoesterase|nr:metallophosphoesterase family protein [Deltaproteobacteria bacterium]